MPRAIVLLSAYTVDQPTNLVGPAAWWSNYFFNLVDGHRAYWLKQSDGLVNLRGVARDWVYFPTGTHNLDKRSECARQLIEWTMDQGVDYRGIGAVIVVLGLHPSIDSDGGSDTQLVVRGQRLPVVVGRVGDPFDFWAHEIGHCLGLGHSFSSSTHIQYVGDVAGAYCHPTCVMSAMAYGGHRLTIYDQTAPSINAVPARLRMWLDTISYQPAQGQRDILIRSRHRFGRDPSLDRQAVYVEMPDGSDYCVEYREPEGWDRGQPGSRVIVTRDKGGLAEKTYGRPGVGSYVWHGEIPNELGFDHAHNFDGFNLQVINRFPDRHSVLVRLRPGRINIPHVTDRNEVTTTARRIVEKGITEFAPGEVRCVQGSWPYYKVERTEQAVMEATYSDGSTPLTAVWTLAGMLLPAPEGEITLIGVRMHHADAKLQNKIHTLANIDVHYRIEPLPNGSRLTVTVSPPAQIFTLRATVRLDSPIGMATQEFACAIQCVEYDYGEEFRNERFKCLADLSDVGARYATYEVIPTDFGVWGKLPPELVEQLTQDLNILAKIRTEEGEAAYARAAAEWAERFQGQPLKLLVRQEEPLRVTETFSSCELRAPRGQHE